MNTGVSINGVAGFVGSGHFLIPNVSLSAGSNTLSVEANTLPGGNATSSVTVTQNASVSPVQMQADSTIGFAPYAVGFRYIVGSLPDGASPQTIAINFKGSGPDDYSGPLSGAPASYTYAQPGAYAAHITVTDSTSQTYTAAKTILVQDVATQRGMLCDVYGYLRDRLAAQDAAGAGNSFQAIVRSRYVTGFNELGANMPSIGQQLGVVVDGQMTSGFADLLIVRDNVDQTRSGFPVRLTLGTDGVWRISEM